MANPFAALTEYELRNLVAHLDAAGRHEQLHRVLELTTDDGRNAWYEAQLASGDAEDHAADVALAWRAADEAGETGLQVRYALVTSTLNSHAQNLPPELAVAALARGVWSGRRAFGFVGQLQDPAARAAALAAIAVHVDEALREEVADALVSAVGAAAASGTLRAELLGALPGELPRRVLSDVTAIADPEERALALLAIAPRLPEPARAGALRAALAAARDTEAAGGRLRAFAGLVPVLRDPARAEAATEALAALRRREEDRTGTRLAALTDVAPCLTEEQREAAVRVVRTLGSWEQRVAGLAALAPHLTGPQLAGAVERARKLRAKQERVASLAVLANHVPGPESSELRDEAIAAARATPAHLGRAVALAGLVARLPEPARETIVDEALAALDRGWVETEPLLELTPHLSERQVESVLAIARALDEPGPRTSVLSALWPRVPARLRRSVLTSRLAAARAETYAPFRFDALVELIPLLSKPAARRAAGEALDATRSLEAGEYRAGYYARLAPLLPEDLLRAAIDDAQAIGDRGPRSLLLLALAAPEPAVVEDAFAVAREFHDARERAPLLVELAPHLPEPLLEEALTVITPRSRDDAGEDEALVAVVAALAPRLPEPLLARALDLVASLGYLEQRAAGLAALGPHLPRALFDRALAVAREIPPGAHADGSHGGSEHHGAEALAALARSGAPVLEDALAAARAVSWPRGRAETFAALLPHVPAARRGAVVAETLAALREADIPPDAAARIIIAAVPHVGGAAAEALRAARELRDDVPRAWALLALGQVDEALAATRAIEPGGTDDTVDKLALLSEIAERVPQRDEVLRDALAVALAMDSPAYRFGAGTARLLPLLAPADRERVLERALEQAREWHTRDQTLLEIAPSLAGPAQVAVVREALAPVIREARRLPRFAALPRATLLAAWPPALHDLVTLARPELLGRLRDVVPLLVVIGGGEAPPSLREAIVAVTAWWP